MEGIYYCLTGDCLLSPLKSVPATDVAPASLDLDGRWRLRFWSVFSGQASSLLGSALTQFVLIWWITDTTGDISALATAVLAALLPQALLGPLGGALADRYSRRLVMIASDLVSAACMCVLIALFLMRQVELWHIYVMMAVRSAAQAFQAPAAVASTTMLVPAYFLPRAAGLQQMLQGMLIVAAAPLGALAIGAMPIGYALCIDVVTAILAVVPLLIFAVPQPKSPEQRTGRLWSDLIEGVQEVWQRPVLRMLYLLLAVVVLVIMPSFTLAPLLVKDYFAGAIREVAIIEGLGGAGMLLGGLLVAAAAPTRLLLWILVGSAVSCFTLGFVGLVPRNMFWFAVVVWTASSVSFIAGNAPLTTLIQTTVAPRLQGRVLSLLNTVMAIAAPVGLGIATPLGQLIGVRWLFVVIGIVSGFVCLAGFLSPALRNGLKREAERVL